jgi:hypothetical protein
VRGAAGAGNAKRRGDGFGAEVRKQFFVEKKNQITFISSVLFADRVRDAAAGEVYDAAIAGARDCCAGFPGV